MTCFSKLFNMSETNPLESILPAGFYRYTLCLTFPFLLRHNSIIFLASLVTLKSKLLVYLSFFSGQSVFSLSLLLRFLLCSSSVAL